MSNDSFLHFDTFEKIPINDNFNIPTAVYKDKKKIRIGYDAFQEAGNIEYVNRNFKLELGKEDLSKYSRENQKFKTAGGESLSAMRITELFLNKVVEQTNKYINDHSFSTAKSIMVAEPLSLLNNNEINEQWLSIYRKNLKDYFSTKGFENISFLPEPFAVFQYYKYCKKFMPLMNKDQFVVFVADFGGGTFDTCIIETSKDGNLKKGGKNSKPLGASSIPFGGTHIDEHILNYFLKKIHPNDEIKIKKTIRANRAISKNKITDSGLSEEQRNFIKNYNRSLIDIQEYKEILSNQITNWELNADISESITISLPENFFNNPPKTKNFQFTSIQFRQIFFNLFEENLKTGIRKTLERGLETVYKKTPDYILLSGGSAKIGWLFNLMCSNFKNYVGNAQKIHIANFKEVVSAGLSVECARRFFNEDGDFADVTYNRVNLLLDPNRKGIEIPNYITRNFKTEDKGVLIPSSAMLRKHFNKELKWRFKLKHEPKHKLSYYFLKDKLDVNNYDFIQNLTTTEIRVDTKSFDKHLELNLVIRDDGTAIPKFKFNSNGLDDSVVSGEPFTIDMTFGDRPHSSESYIGIDFGTTNSSVSYVSNKHIEKYEENSQNFNFDMNKRLIDFGPLLVSYPLARFVNEVNEEAKVRRYINLIENSLSLFLYIAIIEIKITNPQVKIELIKYQRASGSIVFLIKRIKKYINDECSFSKYFKNILTENFIEQLDKAAKFINDFKHPKSNAPFNFDPSLTPVLQGIIQLMNNCVIGFFNNIKQVKFSEYHTADFILSHGNGVFADKLKYEGNRSKMAHYAYIIDKDSGKALNLFPFIHWDHCAKHRDEDFGHMFIWDKYEEDGLLFSVAKGNCQKKILKSESHFCVFSKKLYEVEGIEESNFNYEQFDLKD